MKQDHHSKVKEMITKHVKEIQQNNNIEQNYISMIDAVQQRNRHLDVTVELLLDFVTSSKIISEYTKYKKKVNIDI